MDTAILAEKDTTGLAGLLEKLSEHWMKLAPNKPSYHEKQLPFY